MINASKKTVLSLIIISLLVMTSFIGCGSNNATNTGGQTSTTPTESTEPAEEAILLRMATYNPAEAGQSLAKVKFADDIELLTDGRLKFEFYPGSMLLAADKMYDGVVEGIADIGYSNLAYTFGRFPVTETLDLPLGFPNGWVANHVAADFYRHFTPKEFDETHIITLTTSSLNNIITISTPIHKPEDLHGMTLRGTGYVGQLLESMGGVARALPMPEMYDYLSKSIVDGALIPYETMQTYNYAEVVHNITEIWQASSVFTFFITMNKNVWDSLPADIQEIITNYAEEQFIDDLANMWNNIGLEGKRYAVANDFDIYVVPDEEVPVWQEKADKVINDYKAKMLSNGYTESEMNEWFDFINERTAYWLDKQIELGIKSETGPPEVYQQY